MWSRGRKLEGVACTWFAVNSAALFREGPIARETFDSAINWARPTPYLYENFRPELVDAALRGSESAVRYLAIATLNEVEGYGLAALIELLRKDPAVLGALSEDAAFLVQQAEPDSALLAVAIRFWTLLLDADRPRVSAQVLNGLGRWTFVDNIDDEQWADLTARTLDATEGRIDYADSVADRAARILPSSTSRDILMRLLNNNKPWERHHVAVAAIAVLHASTAEPVDESFYRLRIRLIDLGYHEASTITPPDTFDQC